MNRNITKRYEIHFAQANDQLYGPWAFDRVRISSYAKIMGLTNQGFDHLSSVLSQYV